MKKVILALFFLCVGLIVSRLAAGAEYYKEQILPTMGWILFSGKYVGLISEKHQLFGGRRFYMVYDRSGRTFEEMSEQQFNRIFPKNDRYKKGGSNPSKNIRDCYTSDGMHIIIPQLDCRDPKNEKPFSRITINGQPVNVPVNSCSTISSVEAVSDQLWFGTYLVNDDFIGQKDGLVVIRRDTFKRLKQLDASYIDAPICHLRLDPYDKTVWVATEGGGYLVDASFDIQEKYYFYHTFAHSRNRPELAVWHDKRKSHPLAVIARLLPVEDQTAFVKEAKALPKSLAMQFDLYTFFMCCNFEYKQYPAGLKFMVPYILRAGLAQPKGERYLWYQAMCHIDDPQAEIYCREREASW